MIKITISKYNSYFDLFALVKLIHGSAARETNFSLLSNPKNTKLTGMKGWKKLPNEIKSQGNDYVYCG